MQRLIPRPVWLIAVLSALFLAPAPAQRRESAVGVVPPQPVQLNVKVRREGKTEIPLRIHGLASEPLQYLIRTPPVQGRLAAPRQTGRETAVAVYEPPADLAITTDRFFYAVKSAAGVSAPVEVSLTIIDQPPQLTIPDTLEFSEVRTGATSSKHLEITNAGGGIAMGEVIVAPPWRLDGKGGYRLAAGEIAVFKVVFAPVAGGVFENVARFTSDPAHSTTLKGSAQTSVVANPPELVLKSIPGDSTRVGTLELINQTDEPRELQLKGDERLKLPPQLTLAGQSRISVSIEMAPGDARALKTEIRIVAPDLELRVPVRATALDAVVRAGQTAINFGRVAPGQVAKARFDLENIGGAPADITWTVGSPFRMPQTSALLLPGEKRGFDIEVESANPGRFRGWVQYKAGTQAFDIALEAEVAAGAGRPNAPARAAAAKNMNPSAPSASAEAEPVAPESVEEVNAPSISFMPVEWFGDRPLPPGVRVAAVTPTTATLEWPASLSPATQFRVDLRQLAYAPDGGLAVNWLELGGLEISREGANFVTTIRDLEPAQPWIIRVSPANGAGENRLFAIEFHTPPKSSYLPQISPLRGLLAVLFVLFASQAYLWWRRRSEYLQRVDPTRRQGSP